MLDLIFLASRSSVSKTLTGSRAAEQNVAELVHPVRKTSGGPGRKKEEDKDG